MTANHLLECPDSPRPPCWNRAPYLDGRVRVGFDESGNRVEAHLPNSWFVDRCAVRDGRGIGPNGENYAEANGYLCEGCRWYV